jgi:hypothetical protein
LGATITNPAANTADEVIKSIENILVPIAENAIIAAVPALGLPVIKQITQAIEQALANKLTALAQQGITFSIIDVQVGTEENNISEALQNLIAAEKSGNATEIQTAIQNYQAAQTSLVNSDGAKQPTA